MKYINGLDTYRAIAALVVLVSHIELFKNKYQLKNIFDSPFFQYTGGYVAVIMFFTLSGFLITILLLEEKKNYHTIKLKSFYLRRILRVWPLYYLVILISYVILDYNPSIYTLVLSLSIFPNVAQATGAPWLASPQIWSIGIEEQFYLFWPHIIKKRWNVRNIIICMFILLSILPHLSVFLFQRIYPHEELVQLINKLFYGMKFNCMAIGGLGAILITEKSKIIKFMGSNRQFSLCLIITPFILWLLGVQFNQFTAEIYSILFAISIIGLYNIQMTRDFHLFKFLGKISYGIYMYHWIVIELIFRTSFINSINNSQVNIFIYTSVFSLTILIAYVSFRFIETPFLNFKKKLSV